MTGRHIKVEALGDNALGVTLHGDPRRPEPALFVVTFPGGHVEVSRTTDGQYWVHAAANRPEQCHAESGLKVGRIADARVDRTMDGEEWHLAVLVGLAPVRVVEPATVSDGPLFAAKVGP